MFPKLFSQSHLPRDAQLLTAATGIFCISFMGIQLLLKPLYILRLGYGVEYLGLFGATGAMTYLAMSVPSGMLSSYWGVRPTMLLGGVITIIGMAILPLVEYLPTGWQASWPIFTQMVLTAGWAFFNVNLVPALMATTTAETRNSAFALNSTLRGFGALLGMVTGGLLPSLFAWQGGFTLDMPDPYRLGLWLSAVLGIAGLAPLFLLQTRPPPVTYAADQPRSGFPLPTFLLLILHVLFAQAGIAACQTFCTAYMDSDLKLVPSVIGLITGAGQLAAVLAPLLAPRLAVRYGNAWILIATTEGKRGYTAFTSNYSCASTAKSPELAVDCLVYLTSEEAGNWSALEQGTGQPNARKSVWGNEKLLNERHPIFQRVLDMYNTAEIPGPFPMPYNLRFQEVQDNWANTSPDLFYGDVGFEEGLQAVQDAMQEILDLERA